MILTRRAILFAALATAALAPASAVAAPSDLDPAFDQDGKAVLPFTAAPADVELQPDGKLVVVGTTSDNQIGIWRVNADGTPDRGFDDDGAAVVEFAEQTIPAYVALQAGGKIVVSGRTSGGTATAIARLTAAGELDASFDPGNGDGDGKKVIPQDAAKGYYLGGLIPQPDGRLLVPGRSTAGTTPDFGVLVLKENGAVDAATYEPADFDGREDTAAVSSVAPDGKLVLAGSSTPLGSNVPVTTVARYGADRKLDTGFGEKGRVVLPGTDLYTVLVQPDGGVLLASKVAGKAIVKRLTPAGQPDASFGDGGIAAAAYEGGEEPITPVAAALAQDGGFVLTGTNAARDAFALARFDARGRPDARFGAGGKASVGFGGLTIGLLPAFQPDGKLVITGVLLDNLVPKLAIARLLADFVPPAGDPGPGDPGAGSGGPGSGGDGGPVADTQAPALTRLGVTRKVAGKRPQVRFTLSEPARVRLVLARKGGRKLRFSVAAAAGPNRFRAPRRAPAGRYRLTATAVDAAGNAALPVRVRFRLARP